MKTELSLQRITLLLESHEEEHEVTDFLVDRAMESYKWAYPNEEEHDVLVKIVARRCYKRQEPHAEDVI